ncbi:MAG: polysaccharide biosynthesis tyrosine autokinase [Blastocatellia bacterium]|nr:polysaccharide biosynthesis tyrosine autokinase [Blastocatellia bacterium]
MAEERFHPEKLAPVNHSGSRLPQSYPESFGSVADWTERAGSAGEKQSAGIPLLREWRRIILRHKWMILAIVLVALPFVAVQAYRAKPVYQAMASIEVRKDAGGSLAKSGELIFVDSNDNTKAEIYIIKSQPVLEKTVMELKLDQNSRFLDVNARRSVWDALLAIKGEDPEEQRRAQFRAQPETPEPPATENPKEQLLESRDDKKRLAPYIRTLAANLTVEGVRDTRLVRISFTHTDPEVAATVANGIASSFVNYNFDTKTERFTDASEWLENSTGKLKAQVEKAEQKLADYSRQHNIFSMDGKENLTADKLSRLHDLVMRAETDRVLKQSLYEEVQRGRVAQLPEAFADPKTAELRKALYDLAVSASQLKVKFGERHPKLQEVKQQMITIQEQIDSNRSTLEEKLRADYERAVRDEESLKASLERAKGEAVQQNQATIQYSVLQQDLATAKSLYTDFLNKTSQASIQRAEQFNNVRQIERAEPPTGPIGPKRTQAIALGFLVSLGFGVGLAYLLEKLNTSIRNVEDVSRFTQLPTLAVIPTLGDDLLPANRTNILLDGDDNPKEKALPGLGLGAAASDTSAKAGGSPNGAIKEFSAATEAYRMLRTSVLLSTASHPPKTLLITSGQPGDGKSTTALNLAIAFTQLDHRVIVIDCDMRKPRIHKLTNVKRGEGLSTLLTTGGDWRDFVRPTSIPNLSVIPCGHIPPNPSELISSDKMRELLQTLAENYDQVIVDSPPLVTVTDPVILSTLVDGVIVVAKSAITKSEVLRRACHELATVNSKVLGVVLNNFNMRGEGDDYYYYYRYRYDYADRGKTTAAGD